MARKSTTKDSWKNHRTLLNTLIKFDKIKLFPDLLNIVSGLSPIHNQLKQDRYFEVDGYH